MEERQAERAVRQYNYRDRPPDDRPPIHRPQLFASDRSPTAVRDCESKSWHLPRRHSTSRAAPYPHGPATDTPLENNTPRDGQSIAHDGQTVGASPPPILRHERIRWRADDHQASNRWVASPQDATPVLQSACKQSSALEAKSPHRPDRPPAPNWGALPTIARNSSPATWQATRCLAGDVHSARYQLADTRSARHVVRHRGSDFAKIYAASSLVEPPMVLSAKGLLRWLPRASKPQTQQGRQKGTLVLRSATLPDPFPQF